MTVRVRIIMRLDGQFARGTRSVSREVNYCVKTFAACGGAAIYRRKVFDEIGLFDERHFAYLEDIDIRISCKINMDM